MAKMKHGRKPERNKPARPLSLPWGRGRRAAPRQGGGMPGLDLDRALERELDRELRPTRAFREELAQAYGVEEVPRRAKRSLEKALAELPDQVPVRPRPVLWAFRKAATALAALAVTFGALLGVNGSYPQLTEALPGLGQVFMAINGDRDRDEPLQDSPSPSPEPTFAPVEASCEDDSVGELTVANAWCDGKTLSMELELRLSKELQTAMEETAYTDSEKAQPVYELLPGVGWDNFNEFGDLAVRDSAATVWMTSGDDTVAGQGSISAFAWQGDGTATALWTCGLQTLEDTAGPLSVQFEIPDVALVNAAYQGAYSVWEPYYQASFSLTVDTAKNRRFDTAVADNGVTLRSAEYAPSLVEVNLTVPFMGYCGDIPIEMGGDGDGNRPLGVYPELTARDGTAYVLKELLDPGEAESQVGAEAPGDAGADLERGFAFERVGSAKETVQGPLVLTLYETPEFSVYGTDSRRRVVAEFTLDLTTGRAYASEEYLAQGRERSDTAPGAALERLSRGVSGQEYFACGAYLPYEGAQTDEGVESSTSAIFELLCEEDHWMDRSLLVNAYIEDNLVMQFRWEYDGTSGPWEDETGQLTVEKYVPESGGQPYDMLVFRINYPGIPDWEGEPFTRLQLYDWMTDEVLIDDVQQAWIDNTQLLLGAAVALSSAEVTAP